MVFKRIAVLLAFAGVLIFALSGWPQELPETHQKSKLLVMTFNAVAGWLVGLLGKTGAMAMIAGLAALAILAVLPRRERAVAAKPQAKRLEVPPPDPGPARPVTDRLARFGRAGVASDYDPYAHVQDLIDAVAGQTEPGEPPADPAAPRPRPVGVVRRARSTARQWDGALSHLGGLPRLGDIPWPRGKDGRPMRFAVQIACAELAAACPESPLPHTGTMAFFLDEGAVIHVPDGAALATPPDDLLPAYEEGGYPLPERFTPKTRHLFKYWPIDLVGLDVPDGLRWTSEDIDEHHRIQTLQSDALRAAVGEPEFLWARYWRGEDGRADADRLWWYAAGYVARCLRTAWEGVDAQIASRMTSIEHAKAYHARLLREPDPDPEKVAYAERLSAVYVDAIPAIREQAAAMGPFVEQVEAFVAGRDPWQEMTDEEIDLLLEVIAEAHAQFDKLAGSAVPKYRGDLHGVCIKAMYCGDERAFSALPAEIVEVFEATRGLTYKGPDHQVFGQGTVIQDNMWWHVHKHMLLQLAYDDMADMRFGDVGVFQFFLRAEDVAAGRWENTVLTFECN